MTTESDANVQSESAAALSRVDDKKSEDDGEFEREMGSDETFFGLIGNPETLNECECFWLDAFELLMQGFLDPIEDLM